jgi:ribosomal protein S18 acetylase RimI-like enzyme
MFICKLNINQSETAEQIVRLQRDAYRVEAELIGCRNLPPLGEEVSDIATSGQLFYGYYRDGQLLGVISLEKYPTYLLICRLAVQPKYFRRGIASSLLKYVETETREMAFSALRVNTSLSNQPALKLYHTNAYAEVEVWTTHDGIKIVRFEKIIS